MYSVTTPCSSACPNLQGLRANRMPHRWVASDSVQAAQSLPLPIEDEPNSLPFDADAALHCDFDALPFPNQSLDLVVLPHALELSRDPHLTLREVERVLVPEGRVMILGFNPASMWGLRQRLGRARSAVGLGGRGSLYLPRAGEFLGYWRLRDWLRLLSFEVEGGRFGCFRPPYRSAALARTQRLDGRRGRALVAGVRRGLLSGGGQAGARHAPRRPGAQRGTPGAQRRRGGGQPAAPAGRGAV